MFNILNFIDSKDVREYNKDYHFTPMEQAVIISMSERTTLYDKIAALNELLDTYDEDHFEVGTVKDTDIDINSSAIARRMVEFNLKIWNEVLQEASSKGFYALYCEIINDDMATDPPYDYFETMDDAYEALRDSYNVGYNCHYLITHIIPRGRDSVEEFKEDGFIYDSDFKLIQLVPYVPRMNNPYHFERLDDCYVYIPAPFKKGDLIKYTNFDKSVTYGVVDNDYLTKDEAINNHYDSFCYMYVEVSTYDIKNRYSYEELYVYKCEYATEDELDDDVFPLMGVKWVYDGKMSLGLFLNDATDIIRSNDYDNHDILLQTLTQFKKYTLKEE